LTPEKKNNRLNYFFFYKKKKTKNIPLRINVKQPFRNNVKRQRLPNCKTAESSPGAIHNFSPILLKKKRNRKKKIK